MNLLDLMVKIGVQDEASSKVGGIASNITGGLGKAVAGVAKIGAAATAAAAGAAVAIGTAAVNSYAEQEQLWGGVQKLYGAAGMSLEEYAQSVGQSVDEAKGKYDELRQAEGLVAQNAQQAFKTAGMSSNEYMETATQFSASLINSLSGDTVEAARQTDVAMRAISDNVNTFGSDMGSVSDAFKGFSKQNYTMLDNLKLGYGGTKEEMERLIADANEWGAANGKASDLSIDSFSDVVTAIEQIQEKQGIAGTTAREAATTIEGSINMTKAAWQNLLTEFGKEDGDIPARMEELVDSAVTVLIGATDENGEKLSTGILGRVSTIISNLSQAIPTMMPTIQAALSQAIPQVLQIITDTIPILLQLVGTLIQTLIEYLKSVDWATAVQEILTGIMTILQEAAPSLLELIPVILGVVGQIFVGMLTFMGEHAPEILMGITEVILQVIQTMTDNAPAILDAAGQLFMGLVQALPEILPKLLEGIVSLIGTLLQTIVEHGPDLLAAAGKFLMAIVEALPEIVVALLAAIGQMLLQLFDAIGGAAGDLFNAAGQFFGGLLDGAGQKVEEFLDWAAHIPDHILEALGDLGSLLWNAGSSIIGGLWDGMSSAAEGLFNWVSGIAGTIARLKGPLPYDRKVLIDNGLALMAGLQSGIAEGFEQMVMPYVSAIAGEMQSGMAFGDIEGPTIRATYRTAEQQPSMTDAERQIITALRELRQAIPTGVYLDSGSLVGQLAPDMSRAIVGV